MAFDGILLRQVTKQLKQLETGRISKIYLISQYELLIHIRSYNKNYKLIISIHPSYARIHLTSLSYPTPDFPNALTMHLRKHLEGSFIESIEQIELNRLIHCVIKGRNEFKDLRTYHIYIEIMGKHSNFILTDDKRKIIECLKRVSPSESRRILQPGIHYVLPPMIKKHNPYTEEYIVSDNLVQVYEGFSKELSQEVIYRMNQGISFKEIMNTLDNSQSLYITRTIHKDYYHIIPLTFLNCPYESYLLNEGLDIYYDDLDQKDRIKQQTNDLARYIKNEYTKNINKLNKLKKTLFDSENSDDYRIKGDLLYASLHLIQKGMKRITVENYYDNSLLAIDLDPKLDGKANANKYYNKYQKAKNSLKVLNKQIHLTEEEISYFDSLNTLISQADYYDALEIKEELEKLGYIHKKKKNTLKPKNKEPHYTSYQTKDNIIIYVGKNNIQNDYLTFKKAKRNDMWFHVKDMPGSHVIVHSENLDEYTIRLAAKIAAYYSKGRLSSSVPVNYTLIKTLKKPGGNKPGLVLLNQYKTIYIDPDNEFLKEVTKK